MASSSDSEVSTPRSPIPFLLPNYLSKEGVKSLTKYVYKGSDASLIYRFIVSPLNNHLINLIPVWLAPNVITLAGLMCVLVTYFVFLYYAPKFVGDAPAWANILAGVMLFSYQILDNLDGKQARRTKSSSPLGLLFDHGCDAINVTVGSCNIAAAIQTGASWKLMVIWCTGAFNFYFATWEEFHTGELNLPILNGANEGILILALGHFYTAYKGSGFWEQPLYFYPSVANSTIPLLIVTAACVIICSSNLYCVARHVRRKNGSIFFAFSQLIPFTIMVTMFGVWVSLSPQQVLNIHPRLATWTLGFLFSMLVTHMMLSHICSESYHPLRKTLLPFFFVAGQTLFTFIHGLHPVFPDKLAMEVIFLLSAAAYFHMAVCVIREMREALGIRCFHIPVLPELTLPPPAQRKTTVDTSATERRKSQHNRAKHS